MADTLDLPLRKIVAYVNGLSALDGYSEPLLDEKGHPILDEDGRPRRGPVTPYSFPAKTRYAVIKDLGILKRYVDDFDQNTNKTRDSLIVDLSGGTGNISPDDPQYKDKLARIQKEMSDLIEKELNEVHKVEGLIRISLEGLNLDVNQKLPNTVIAQLDTLLTD